MVHSPFKGVIPALVTPFKDGEVDEKAFVALVERQIAGGVHGLVPVGTTGEAATLSDEEAEALIARAAVVRDVAELKAQHWPAACHIRPGREGQMHQAIARRFTGTGFPPLTALSIWRQLIGGSTQIESPLAAVVIEPDHRFLAREYFGLQVSTSVAAHAHGRVAVIAGAGGDGPVVVGVDDSPVSDVAVAEAFRQASLRGVPLVAVHTWTPLDADALHGYGIETDEIIRMSEEALEALGERLEQALSRAQRSGENFALFFTQG